MQRIWLQSFAAILGVLSISGLASAQYQPQSQPQQPPNPFPLVRQVQGVPVPAQSASTPLTPASGAIFVRGSGGCTNCGPGGVGAGSGSTAAGVGRAPIPYAEYCPGCANGCGSLKSDLGFYFGSCKSFFNPCGPLPCNGFGGRCGAYPYGKPYGTGYNGCGYPSYLNH